MDDFYLERDLEYAGIDAFTFSLMDEDERREALEEADLDPDDYDGIEFDSDFDAWRELQDAGLSLRELDRMDEDEGRKALEDAGLDPADYELWTLYGIEPSGRPAPPPAPPPSPSPVLAPEPRPLAQELRSAPAPKPRICRYVSVRFSDGGGLYAYRTEDRSIRPGDRVMAPAGPRDELALCTVVSAGDYTESTAPYPPEKTKFLLRKATEEDLARQAARDKRPEPAAAAQTTTVPPTGEEKAGEAGAPEPEKGGGRRTALHIVIAVLLVIFAALCCVVLFKCSRIEPAPEPEGPGLTVSAAYEAKTPAPTVAPTPGSAGNTRRELDDTQTNDRITDILGRVEDVSAYISWYNEVMWLPDNVAIDYDDIFVYEARWGGYAADMAAIRQVMEAAAPSALFADSWNDLYSFVCAVEKTALILSDWDLNHDGEPTDKECSIVNTRATDAAVEAQGFLYQMSTDYDLAYLLWSARSASTVRTAPAPTPTPCPASAPKRSSSTPKPAGGDPYNARDYYDPDDFYYDYYDDFWDYYDAEDYWDEWNDDEDYWDEWDD